MTSYKTPVNILIVDDHQLIIDGISQILETRSITGTIYTANNGKQAVEMASYHDVDCVIMDINMPVLNGLEATRLIKKLKPGIKIIVVSMLCDVSILNKMLKAGADAFLIKDTGKEELLKTIHQVMNGEKYISPDISFKLLTHVYDRDLTDKEKHLTPREIEIVRHIATGLTNTEIAGKLFLSVVTVETHRKNMLAKLQLKNTATLVKYAADHQLL